MPMKTSYMSLYTTYIYINCITSRKQANLQDMKFPINLNSFANGSVSFVQFIFIYFHDFLLRTIKYNNYSYQKKNKISDSSFFFFFELHNLFFLRSYIICFIQSVHLALSARIFVYIIPQSIA